MRNDQIDDCNPVEVATARLNTKIPAERPLARRRDNKKMLFLHNRIFASSTNASFFFQISCRKPHLHIAQLIWQSHITLTSTNDDDDDRLTLELHENRFWR